jgi:hypothetical protein
VSGCRESRTRFGCGGADAGEAVDASSAESVAGAFEGEDVGVVDDAVDHRGGDGLVAEDPPQPENGRFEVRISEACS